MWFDVMYLETQPNKTAFCVAAQSLLHELGKDEGLLVGH